MFSSPVERHILLQANFATLDHYLLFTDELLLHINLEI